MTKIELFAHLETIKGHFKYFLFWLKLFFYSENIKGNKDIKFSVLVTVYSKTDSEYFEAFFATVKKQSYGNFEMLVLAHGPIGGELNDFLNTIAFRYSWIKLFFLPENLGIIGGMRYLFERARGDFIVPVDADDLLEPDALKQFAETLERDPQLDFIYSDEDHCRGRQFTAPFYRPNWDCVLGLSTSFVWHLVCFRRKLGITVKAYSNPEANFCHDWDTLVRFSLAGAKINRIAKILYHWRQNRYSQTNNLMGPDQAVFKSQRAVLELIGDKTKRPYEIRESAYFRGSTEFELVLTDIDYTTIGFVWTNFSADQEPDIFRSFPICFIKSENSLELLLNQKKLTYVIVQSSIAKPCYDYLDSAITMMEVFNDLDGITGFSVKKDETVVDSCLLKCSDEIRPFIPIGSQTNHGPFGRYSKPISVNFPNSALNIVRASKVKQFIRDYKAVIQPGASTDQSAFQPMHLAFNPLLKVTVL